MSTKPSNPTRISVDPDALINSAELTVGITVPDAYRDGVKQHLNIAAGMAQLVFDAPLEDDSLEMAPVFSPGVTVPLGGTS